MRIGLMSEDCAAGLIWFGLQLAGRERKLRGPARAGAIPTARHLQSMSERICRRVSGQPLRVAADQY